MKLRVYIWSTKTYSSQNGQGKYLCLGKKILSTFTNVNFRLVLQKI